MLKLNSQQADPNSHYLREGMIFFSIENTINTFSVKTKGRIGEYHSYIISVIV